MILNRSNTIHAQTARATALALLAAGLAITGAARAGCADIKAPFAPATSAPPAGSAHLVDAVYRPDEHGARAVLVSDEGYQDSGIVGSWTFEWRAKAEPGLPNDNPGLADGTLLDFGTIQWHGDGTETTVSGGRTPAVGDVCMGSWKRIGPSTFKLTHLAMGYGPPPGPALGYQGLAVLEMEVEVDSGGRAYHGNFTLTQYMSKFDPTVPGSEFDQSTVEFTLSGSVKASRIEVR